jgi:hypothetical protein
MPNWDDLAGSLSGLPLPIAHVVRRAINAKSAVDRHHLAYFAGEVALKLAASARVGVVLDRCLEPGSPAARSLDSLALPSAGHWLGLLRDLSQVLAKRRDAGLLPLADEGAGLTARRPEWQGVDAFLEAAVAEGALSQEVATEGSPHRRPRLLHRPRRLPQRGDGARRAARLWVLRPPG